jgi:hypothetical protein
MNYDGGGGYTRGSVRDALKRSQRERRRRERIERLYKV